MMLADVKKQLTEIALVAEVEVPAPPPAEGEPPAPAAKVAQPLCQETSYRAKGYHLDVTVAPTDVVQAAQVLRSADFFIEAVTGVDWIKEKELEVVYDFNHWQANCRVVIRARVDRAKPEIPTISTVFSGADWHERETHDFFGIIFQGLDDLGPFLLPEDADYHPLLKDFKA